MDSAPFPTSTHRRQVDDALDALGLSEDEVPAPIFDRMLDRARYPGARLHVGRYVIVGELGRGGMGVVYEGWDPGIERRVAIKAVEPDLVPEEDRDEVVERFRQETKLVGRLKHPAIVTVFDSGRELEMDPATGRRRVGLYYYVMEFLEGHSLARVLREQVRLSEAHALQIAVDVAEALQLSHDAGIIHRDIKPSNIFLRDDRDAVLLDFGIAKAGGVALTRQGQILGTPSYLAPERLQEKEVAIDGRADIFSLGVLLYTMLTGEAPFVGHDAYDVIDKIASTSHPQLDRQTSAGAEIADILDRMLAKRPEDRYESAGEVGQAMRAVLSRVDASSSTLDVDGLGALDEEDEELDLERTSPSTTSPVQPEIHEPNLQSLDEPTDANMGPVPGGMDELEVTQSAPDTELIDSSLPHDLSRGLEAPPRPQGQDAPPVRVADVLGTRPDLALLRETRELTKPDSEDMPLPAVDEAPPDETPPSLTLSVDSPSDLTAQEAEEYPPQSSEYDEMTDDETVADSEVRVPDAVRSQPIVRAHQHLVPTEQIVRASDASHADVATEAEALMASPSVRGLEPARRRGRSRIEASLVDEEDVVVQPADLDAMNPDELPTHTGFEVARETKSEAEIVLSPERDADHEASDPADRADRADRAAGPLSRLPDGAAKLRDRELELSSGSGPVPALDLKPSAAVARRTIGATSNQAKAPAPRIKVQGDSLLDSSERSRLIRRGAALSICAILLSVGLGLLLGRINRKEGATNPEQPQLVLAPEPTPTVKPRGPSQGANGLELVRPRSAKELVQDAEAARLSGHLDDAARLFEAAVRATGANDALKIKALLGRADVLRQLGNQSESVRLYRDVAQRYPNSLQAEQAKVALEELGEPVRPRRRTPKRSAAKAPIEQPVPRKAAATAPLATPDERCRAAVRDNLSQPREAVRALRVLADELPGAPCVFWFLGTKHEQLGETSRAVVAYKRFLELAPSTPRRAAVERKIGDLQRKLQR